MRGNFKRLRDVTEELFYSIISIIITFTQIKSMSCMIARSDNLAVAAELS